MKKTKRKLFNVVIVLLIGSLLVSCGNKKEKSDMKWWQKTIVYEAYPSSFKDSDGNGYGDLRGLISKLDHLSSLGVGAIWLTPVFASPMGDNGYDVADFYSINPLYGTMADMDELIAEADKRNIKIVMDLVFNHTSNENQWFIESSSSKNNDKSDWYIWADPKEDGSAPNNWRGIFGGSAWTYCENRNQYYLHTFADFQPDLNWENPDVRRALFDVANFWLDKGVGGFRVDAVTYIKKPVDFSDGPIDGADGLSSIHNLTANSPGILVFLHEFKKEVREGKDIFMVGEANGVPNNELDAWVGKDGVFDMIFGFDLMNICFASGENSWTDLKDFKLKEFKSIISKEQYLTKDSWCPVFFENHDQPRSVEHFLKNADNIKGAKALGMLLMTLRGTPFVYQGEEIGMSNVNRSSIEEYNDISSINHYYSAIKEGYSPEEALLAVNRFSRDNARSPMQWDSSLYAGFSTGVPWLKVNDNYLTVNVKAENEDESSVLNFYRKLAKLRNEYAVLYDGAYKELLEDSDEIFAFTRDNGSSKIVVLINFTNNVVSYDETMIKDASLLLSSDKGEKGALSELEAQCWLVD